MVLSIITIGHVDAGKTTLSKCLTDIDETEDEKERQITIEVAKSFIDDNTILLDCPGHHNFVPATINAISQADIAIYVVSARKGEFKVQSREHLLIAKIYGVRKLIVAINKIDTETEDLEEVQKEITYFLKKLGISNYIFVQISAKNQIGIDELKSHFFLDTPNQKSKNTLGIVTDTYQKTIYCKLLRGSIKQNQELVQGKVLKLTMNNKNLEEVKQGDNFELQLNNSLKKGDIISDKPFKEVKRIIAEIYVLRERITKGFQCMIHVCAAEEECIIYDILSKDLLLIPEKRYIVKIELQKEMFIETKGKLSKFVLRSSDKTVAVGIVKKTD